MYIPQKKIIRYMRKYLTIRALTEKGLIFMLISVLAIAYLQNIYTILLGNIN